MATLASAAFTMWKQKSLAIKCDPSQLWTWDLSHLDLMLCSLSHWGMCYLGRKPFCGKPQEAHRPRHKLSWRGGGGGGTPVLAGGRGWCRWLPCPTWGYPLAGPVTGLGYLKKGYGTRHWGFPQKGHGIREWTTPAPPLPGKDLGSEFGEGTGNLPEVPSPSWWANWEHYLLRPLHVGGKKWDIMVYSHQYFLNLKILRLQFINWVVLYPVWDLYQFSCDCDCNSPSQ